MNNKDIYLHIASFADDKTVLTMLSVNKKFNKDEFYKQIFSKRYPELTKLIKIEGKTEGETERKTEGKTEEREEGKKSFAWKIFYIGMVTWIIMLKEMFRYDYIKDRKYNITKEIHPKYIIDKFAKLRNESYIELLNTKTNLFLNVSLIIPGYETLSYFIQDKYIISPNKIVPGYKICSDNIEGIIYTAKLIGDYSIISLWDN